MRKKAILKLYRGEIDSSDEKGTKRSFEDDGFGQLGAEDYLQARTQFYLDKFKKRLPGMSRQKNTINLAMYIATGAWPYNRPCAQQYVGKSQSCMVISGRLIVLSPRGVGTPRNGHDQEWCGSIHSACMHHARINM